MNQHSYFLAVAVVLLVAAFIAWRVPVMAVRIGVVALAIVGLVAWQAAMRSGPSTVATPQQVEAALHSGSPVLVEVYSDL
ncbi:MAG: hypothetical protein HY683_02435 [Chloroflexi bacterium]|nr:hypothetical protein [Chloroflexota bacterium]